jgi:Uma2 family endonuclease
MATIEMDRPVEAEPVTARPAIKLAGQRRLFTVNEYSRLHEVGIIQSGERVELIEGGVRIMSPIGPIHAEVVNRLSIALVGQMGSEATVSFQNPVRLGEYSLPQPDLLLLRIRNDGYLKELPKPEDVLLLIEVSDSTIAFDRNEKLPRYAAAQIPEAWIVDTEKQQIEQYSHPNQGRYEKSNVWKIDDVIKSLGSPQIVIEVKKLFV